jgi:hypothetical protein
MDISINMNHDFTFCFVWVLNLVAHTKGRTQIEGVQEGGGAEDKIWT